MSRIHVVGGSGSGTTTLARALGARLGCPSFDTDFFYWLPSNPPFQQKRDIPDRITMLKAALDAERDWVLSGSLAGWGDEFIPYFTDVVFLTLPQEVRMARLAAREVERYGAARIAPGGDLHDAHIAFMDWAALYDQPGHEQRSHFLHDLWISQLPARIRVHRLSSLESVDQLVGHVVGQL